VVRVWEDGPSGHGAGVRVEPIVDEIELALVGRSHFIRQPEIDGAVLLACVLNPGSLDHLLSVG
jgi:hypothetical protein